MEQLTTQEQVDGVLGGGPAIVYKHSFRCPISAGAHQEVQEFLDDDPGVPVFMVDVVAHGELSRYVAERTGVEHHSPQAILVSEGEARWHASHYDITADVLRQQTTDAGR